MSGVVKGMDITLKSMNLEKVEFQLFSNSDKLLLLFF